jgi:hypothetical protein
MAIAAICNALALSVPFKRSVLTSGAEAQGVAWQIGSPRSQTLALLPSALVSLSRSEERDSKHYSSARTTIPTSMAPADFVASM